MTSQLIPFPLPQHQHTFCQRRRFDQDCPGLRQVDLTKTRAILVETSSLTKSVLVLRERKWYYHDNPARENLFMTNQLFRRRSFLARGGANTLPVWNLKPLPFLCFSKPFATRSLNFTSAHWKKIRRRTLLFCAKGSVKPWRVKDGKETSKRQGNQILPDKGKRTECMEDQTKTHMIPIPTREAFDSYMDFQPIPNSSSLTDEDEIRIWNWMDTLVADWWVTALLGNEYRSGESSHGWSAHQWETLDPRRIRPQQENMKNSSEVIKSLHHHSDVSGLLQWTNNKYSRSGLAASVVWWQTSNLDCFKVLSSSGQNMAKSRLTTMATLGKMQRHQNINMWTILKVFHLTWWQEKRERKSGSNLIGKTMALYTDQGRLLHLCQKDKYCNKTIVWPNLFAPLSFLMSCISAAYNEVSLGNELVVLSWQCHPYEAVSLSLRTASLGSVQAVLDIWSPGVLSILRPDPTCTSLKFLDWRVALRSDFLFKN